MSLSKNILVSITMLHEHHRNKMDKIDFPAIMKSIQLNNNLLLICHPSEKEISSVLLPSAKTMICSKFRILSCTKLMQVINSIYYCLYFARKMHFTAIIPLTLEIHSACNTNAYFVVPSCIRVSRRWRALETYAPAVIAPKKTRKKPHQKVNESNTAINQNGDLQQISDPALHQNDAGN